MTIVLCELCCCTAAIVQRSDWRLCCRVQDRQTLRTSKGKLTIRFYAAVYVLGVEGAK
jgi:hypothetical protein